MKKHGTSLLLLGATSAAILCLAGGTPGDNKPPANADLPALQNEVAQLRSRVQTLEDRTKKLESAMEKLNHPQRPTPLNGQEIQPSPPKSPSLDSGSPKIWGSREVNGWTFYIVPCEQQRD